MPELIAMDRTGDTRIIWDPQKADEVSAARKLFDELKGKRYLAYKVKKDGSKGEVIREFDPEAERIILAPPMTGG